MLPYIICRDSRCAATLAMFSDMLQHETVENGHTNIIVQFPLRAQGEQRRFLRQAQVATAVHGLGMCIMSRSVTGELTLGCLSGFCTAAWWPAVVLLTPPSALLGLPAGLICCAVFAVLAGLL